MNKVDLSQYDNSWYNSNRFFRRLIWYIVNTIFLNNPLFPISRLKIFLLRLFGAKIGKNVNIKPCVNIKYPWNLRIGNNVWIGEQVWIDNLGMVSINDNVCISQGALLLTGNHNYMKNSFDLMIGEIVLEDGVWIGAQSIVCPGIKCASHSVLTVGSVANRDLESYTIYQGYPARKIKKRVIYDSK